MKRYGLKAGALVLTAAMLLSGCDQVYEMTEDETAAVVSYSSHVVTKFNKKQSEGIVDVAAYKAQLALQEEARKKEEEEAAKQAEAEENQTDSSSRGSDSAAGQSTESDGNRVSLNQALQLGGLDAVYKKYTVSDTYKASDSYMVSANSGNELVVVQVSLVNNGNKTASCDMLSKMASFRLTVNGEHTATADTTILLNDLGTYQGKIKAGKSKKTLLIFQFPKGSVKKVTSMELEVTIGDNASTVKLV